MAYTLYNLTEEDKKALKLSYLDTYNKVPGHSEKYFILELGMTVPHMVTTLYKATVSKAIDLSTDQLKDLVADIEYCKSKGYWSTQGEKQIIDLCKKVAEEKAMYQKMSDKDKKAFDELRTKAIEDFLAKAEREQRGMRLC